MFLSFPSDTYTRTHKADTASSTLSKFELIQTTGNKGPQEKAEEKGKDRGRKDEREKVKSMGGISGGRWGEGKKGGERVGGKGRER